MTSTIQRTVASGATDTFTVPFPYLDKSHVVVLVNGVELASSAYTWPDSSNIKITAGAPSAGSIVERHRATPTTPLTEFSPGNLDSADLNVAALQPLYVAQEAADKATDVETRAWLTANYGNGGTVTVGSDGTVPKFASGELVEGPDGDQLEQDATNAAASATAAAASATAASGSASAAASSETNAAASASAAASSKTAAETAETSAAASASAASGSATAAAGSASGAASSATAAATSETNAAASETNAAASATAAGNAQAAAEGARDSALAAYANFSDAYLGSHSTAPTQDTDGSALEPGDLYYDSVLQAMQVWTGSAWVAAYVSGAGVPLLANNGSDYDAATFRTNISVYSKAESDARYATAAQGATADAAMPKAGGAFSGGVNFGSAAVASPTDLTRHFALFSTASGFSITAGQMNYVVALSDSHVWYANGVEQARLNKNGLQVGSPTGGAPGAGKVNAVDYLINGTPLSTTFANKADLASTAAGKGASLVGIQDAAGNTTATTVEAAIADLYSKIAAGVGLGIGQSWQDVSASRATATAYHNTTGKPIQVSVGGFSNSSTPQTFQVSSDSASWIDLARTATSGGTTVNAVIPDGWYYRVTQSSGTTTWQQWAELR